MPGITRWPAVLKNEASPIPLRPALILSRAPQNRFYHDRSELHDLHIVRNHGVKFGNVISGRLSDSNYCRYASTNSKPTSPESPDPIAEKKTTKKQPQQQWRVQKDALKKKFAEGWAPPKRLSPDAIEGVRELHRQNPQKFSTPVLAEHFKVSPEAIRRILKSKWRPSEKEMEKRKIRWEKRKDRIWDHMSELGLRPRRETPDSPLETKTIDKLPGNQGKPF
ncbi:predicted protein [Uncinocarpus reesii 1704]|uniref:Required for respiratory growth protein 9, mitochondrial n=1 Tax=Uncinocarpus reesii (strain UAMH 1704) TaxID=336963 RepID=RRG9_UNCRE|nr:uncharacterized protein UREG_06405 [Uncinocarpus reesii 1704]C4JXN2.1 RecName: Full=Required for respiratory growth protein 9, mitochondrial; Flags: Precursor [Uncinocarpus reesii 1704]EEP81540.1 predicted protein [Uncinocarpus reesii 1704]